MPNYPTHARWGRAGAVVMAIGAAGAIYYLFATIHLAAAAGVGASAATFVGAIFPDIDHHASVPREKATRALQILFILALASLAALQFETIVALSETAITTTGVDAPAEAAAGASVALFALVAAGLVDPAIGVVTREHRGWTHNAGIMLVLTGLLCGGMWVLTTGLSVAEQTTAIGVVGTFYVGVLIHLGLDGEII